MDLKDLNDIKVPDNIDLFIKRGVDKAMNEKSAKKNFFKRNKEFSMVIALAIAVVVVSNVDIVAQELVKIPVVGKVIKVLNFTTDFDAISESGGKPAPNMNVESDNTNNEVFLSFVDSQTGKPANELPPYEFKYMAYPYSLVLTFNDVRNINPQEILKNLENLPYVKRTYRLLHLSDSGFSVCVEFDRNVEVNMNEVQNPAMLKISAVEGKKAEHQELYFITNESREGEDAFQINDVFFGEKENRCIKDDNGFYVQFGPYKTEEEATQKLQEINSVLEEYSFENSLFKISKKSFN